MFQNLLIFREIEVKLVFRVNTVIDRLVDLACYSCSYMNRLFTAGAGLAACIHLHAYCKPAQAVNNLFM